MLQRKLFHILHRKQISVHAHFKTMKSRNGLRIVRKEMCGLRRKFVELDAKQFIPWYITSSLYCSKESPQPSLDTYGMSGLMPSGGTFTGSWLNVPLRILTIQSNTGKKNNSVKKLKLKLIYDRQSVGQSVLMSGAHLGPVTNFSFAMKFPLDSCDFGIL
jgi:hypothetical protein